MRVFFALQIADVVTTYIFRAMGVAETNPVAIYLMQHFGTLAGLLILKTAAISIALVCGMGSHPTFMRWVNGFYGVIVAINYLSICSVLHG